MSILITFYQKANEKKKTPSKPTESGNISNYFLCCPDRPIHTIHKL